jgi:hypothetical protein
VLNYKYGTLLERKRRLGLISLFHEPPDHT